MPITVSHALSATTPDDPAYEIQPKHWNSAHIATFNAVGSEIIGAFSNGGGVSFGLETNGFITGAAPAGGGGLTNIKVSAGSTSNNLSALTFSNGSGVSFGLNGSVITGSVQTNYLTTAMASNAATISNIRVSAGTTSNLLSALTFSNSNGVSFGINGSNITASHNGLTTARASNDGIGLATARSNVTWTVNSAGLSLDARGYVGTGFTGTNATATLNSNGLQLSVVGGGTINQTGPNIAAGGVTVTDGTVQFSNANGVSFGLAGSTMTASVNAGGGATLSFFENVPVIHGTQTFNAVSSTMYIYPFSLEQNMSVGFIRLPMSGSIAPTTAGVPVANSTITGRMGYTHGFVLYTQGTGASANSLRYFTSTSGTGSFGTTIGAGANSSQMTVTVNGSFGQSGVQTNLGTGVSYGISSGSHVINSSAMSNFTGPRFVDIPFAQSLSPGDYWVGIGRSWSSANNSSIFNGVNPLSSNIFISQTNITWGILGSSTNTSNIMRQPGAGFFTTNASIISTNSINAVGQISVTTSNLVPYFQFIRKA
jgi:hypothetical protein